MISNQYIFFIIILSFMSNNKIKNNKNENNDEVLSLEEFSKIPAQQIHIGVQKFNSNIFGITTYEVSISFDEEISKSSELIKDYTIQKRYTEFQGFYDSLTIRYQNINFPAFPSKFQLINQKESRRKFFDSLLKTVRKLAIGHVEIRKEIMKLLYDFFFKIGSSENVKSNPQRKASTISTDSNLGPENLSMDPEVNSSNGLKITDDLIQKFNSQDNNRRTSLSFVNESALIADLFLIENQKEEHTLINGWRIEYKFLKNKFSKGYIKVTEQCLYLYDSIVANNYFLCIPLIKINFQIYRIAETKKNLTTISEITEVSEHLNYHDIKEFTLDLLKSQIHIHLFHNFDYSELILNFCNETNSFSSMLNFLHILDQNQSAVKSISKYISPIDETNSYIYGKLVIEIGQIEIKNFEGNIFANIVLMPYTFKTKQIMGKDIFSMKQTFLLPIHNRFEIMKIEIFSKLHQGLFQKKEVDEKLGEYRILIPDVLNNSFFPNKTVEVEIQNSNKNVKIQNTILISFKVTNYSRTLALAAKNRNKNVLEDMTIAKSEEEISIKTLLKRMKKMITLVKEFKKDFKSLFKFKYPVYSLIMWILIMYYLLFCDMTYMVFHILLVISYAVFMYSNIFQTYISPINKKFIFSIRNPYDFDSIVTTKVDVEEDEVKKENYLTEIKEKKNLIKTIIEPIKNFKNYKNTYHQVLLSFTSFVSSMEKIKNLFLWTDPLLTFYFLVAVICLLTIVYSIKFKYLMLFSFCKKFIGGIFFYKRKYTSNLEVATIILKHCHSEWCSTSNKEKTKHSAANSQNFNSNSIEMKAIKPNEKNEQEKNIDNVMIFDDKYKILIKDNLEKHSDILIKMEFLNSVKVLGQIIDAIAKSKTLLKIKKDSSLYKQTVGNSNIYKSSVDIEMIFLYFVQNIKSDYYISRHCQKSTHVNSSIDGKKESNNASDKQEETLEK